jgi:hypothetical protein
MAFFFLLQWESRGDAAQLEAARAQILTDEAVFATAASFIDAVASATDAAMAELAASLTTMLEVVARQKKKKNSYAKALKSSSILATYAGLLALIEVGPKSWHLPTVPYILSVTVVFPYALIF